MSRVVPADDSTAPVLFSRTSVIGDAIDIRNHQVCLNELAQRLGDLPRPAWDVSSASERSRKNGTKKRGTPFLKDRIKERAGISREKRRVSSWGFWCIPCLKLKDIQWPKMRNRLKEIASYELWNGRIKQVEAYYGTAVAGYFVSLRWLLWVNVALCVVWCGSVCLPQILWEASNAAPASPDYDLRLSSTCNFSNASGFYDCFHYEWYSYVFNLFVGQGIYRYTLLFLGHYSKSSKVFSVPYNSPALILFFTLVTYVISFVLVAFRLGRAYNLDFSTTTSTDLCNKLFSAWDHNVVDVSSIKLKKACIGTDLKEELSELDKRAFKRTRRQLAAVIAIRTATNLLVVAVLTTSGAAIYFATTWSWKERIELSSAPFNGNVQVVLKAFLVPIVMNVLELILPRFFEFVARVEMFKTRGREVAMTMIRTAVVRIGNLGVYTLILYAVISCTQQAGDLYLLPYTNNESCVECWETFLGQQFYTLALTSFLVSIIGTLLIDTTRKYLHKLLHPHVKGKILQNIFSRSTFSISDNILDLVSSQFLLWVGFLFFPLHPLLMIIILLITFYMKWYSLMKNMEPKRRGIFRGALTQFFFTLLLLVVLLIAMIPAGFSVARLKPSENCGPYKGKETMLSVISNLIDSITNYRIQGLIKFLVSSGFLIPLNMAYTATIFLLLVILRAKHKKLQLVKAQLTMDRDLQLTRKCSQLK